MHIVSLQSVSTHKEKATTYFFQANVMDKAVAVAEYFYVNIKITNKNFLAPSLHACKLTAVSWLLGDNTCAS